MKKYPLIEDLWNKMCECGHNGGSHKYSFFDIFRKIGIFTGECMTCECPHFREDK